MKGDLKENVIEWFTGSKRCTVTFSQKKFINRIKNMVKKGEPEDEIVAENQDGSITAHIPLRAVHLTIYRSNNGQFEGDSETDEEDSQFEEDSETDEEDGQFGGDDGMDDEPDDEDSQLNEYDEPDDEDAEPENEP